MACRYYCEEALGLHTLNDCEDEYQGGFVNVIVFECGHQLTAADISNGTAVQAEIDAGRATLFKNIKIGGAAPSATTVASNIAGRPDKVVKYTKEFTLMDGNVNSDNMTLYNRLGSGNSYGGIMLHNEEEGYVHFYNNDLKGQGGLVEPDNDGEFVRFEYTLSVDLKRDAANPTFGVEPSNVFA